MIYMFFVYRNHSLFMLEVITSLKRVDVFNYFISASKVKKKVSKYTILDLDSNRINVMDFGLFISLFDVVFHCRSRQAINCHGANHYHIS